MRALDALSCAVHDAIAYERREDCFADTPRTRELDYLARIMDWPLRELKGATHALFDVHCKVELEQALLENRKSYVTWVVSRQWHHAKFLAEMSA